MLLVWSPRGLISSCAEQSDRETRPVSETDMRSEQARPLKASPAEKGFFTQRAFSCALQSPAGQKLFMILLVHPAQSSDFLACGAGPTSPTRADFSSARLLAALSMSFTALRFSLGQFCFFICLHPDCTSARDAFRGWTCMQ